MRLRSLSRKTVAVTFALFIPACTASQSSYLDLGGSDLVQNTSCALAANTTKTATLTNGCAILTRDASGCMAARAGQGLSGAWLKFSCRVSLTVVSGNAPYVQAMADSQPDYTSNYFPTNSSCYAAYTPSFPDPNQIGVKALTLKFPKTPNTTSTKMGLGPVGVAVNGVAIFDNQAAPGDDIFEEAGSFDRCAGHPAPDSTYHYHSEPYSISYDDANLIGVLKDGYFLYGRRDVGGGLPTLDANGGHTGTTADSVTPIYHYHVNEQTSTTAGTLGEKQWFLTTGNYQGAPLQ